MASTRRSGTSRRTAGRKRGAPQPPSPECQRGRLLLGLLLERGLVEPTVLMGLKSCLDEQTWQRAWQALKAGYREWRRHRVDGAHWPVADVGREGYASFSTISGEYHLTHEDMDAAPFKWGYYSTYRVSYKNYSVEHLYSISLRKHGGPEGLAEQFRPSHEKQQRHEVRRKRIDGLFKAARERHKNGSGRLRRLTDKELEGAMEATGAAGFVRNGRSIRAVTERIELYALAEASFRAAKCKDAATVARSYFTHGAQAHEVWQAAEREERRIARRCAVIAPLVRRLSVHDREEIMERYLHGLDPVPKRQIQRAVEGKIRAAREAARRVEEREQELRRLLRQRGLQLRADSELRRAYIQRNEGVAERIVDTMQLMKFLHSDTDYSVTLSDIYREERELETGHSDDGSYDGGDDDSFPRRRHPYVHFTAEDRHFFSQRAMSATLVSLVRQRNRCKLARLPRFLFRPLPPEHPMKAVGDLVLRERQDHPEVFEGLNGVERH